MATSIFFNGRVISVPGSYTEVDASGLEQVGLGAAGIVAIIGEAEGGRPVSAIEETKHFLRLGKPERVRTTFRSGPLREAGAMLFEPAKDPDITAGAQEVVAMKVNPATQSSATFANAQGDALAVTSRDYGAFTSQINVSIAPGTTKGKLLAITFEDLVESVDDLGGDDIFQFQYSGGANGYDTMVAGVASGGVIRATGTRQAPGADNLITTPIVAGSRAQVSSDNAGDTTQTATVYGLDAGDNPVTEVLALNGTTPFVGAQTWNVVLAIELSAAAAGVVTAADADTALNPVIFDVPAGTLIEGITLFDFGFVNNATVEIVSDGASTKRVLLFGRNAAGAVLAEVLTLTGTTPVSSVGQFASIDHIITGDLEAAQTATLTAVAAATQPSVQTTIQKAADFFNAKQQILPGPVTRGFEFTVVTPLRSFKPANLDVTVADATIKDPATPGFRADLYAITGWINQNSQLVSAAAAAGASGGAPDDTANPVFLTGGSDGVTTFADYQRALNLLKKIRVNSVVVLTGDPAVHAALDAHCAYMGGIGRSERDGFVGVLNASLDDVPTKDQYKGQVVDLNSRHIRAFGQAIERFDTAGERREFLPPFAGCIAAGMQAGSSVGTSLTFKFANVLGFRQHPTWNPTDDAEEMIQSGACFLENVDGVGRRWVRNVTTHLSSNNIAFTEGSVNEAVNFAVFNFRTQMEFAVGKKGFLGTINAAKGKAIGVLGLLVDAGVLVTHRALDIELIVDVLDVSVEIAPVIPINFVKTTVHLVTVRQAAA